MANKRIDQFDTTTPDGSEYVLIQNATTLGYSKAPISSAVNATSYTKIEVDTSLAGKAEAIHVHAIADTIGLQAELDGKSAINHTHTAADTTDFDTEVSNNTDVAANTAARHTHANSAVLNATTASFTTADETKLDGIESGAQVNTVTSVAGKTGAVTLDKADVGLSNVDNLAPADMPVSTATQTALDGKATKLDIAQYSIPYRSTTGTGEVNTNLPARDSAATPGSVAVRDGAGAIHTATPTATTHATTKAYVDTADALKVNKAGDTMTGVLTSNQIAPAADSTYTLGTSSLYWKETYTNKLFLNSTATLDGSTAGEIKGTGIFTADNIKRGTGFPEGVVTANVGTVYIDTAVTNGASSWIKKSGTGNTGWKVLEGDTGWRNVESLLLTGLTKSTVVGRALLRRKCDTVYFNMKLDVAQGAIVKVLGSTPLGFRAPASSSISYEALPPPMTADQAGAGLSMLTVAGRLLVTEPGNFVTTGVSTPWPNPGTVLMGGQYISENDWPATLPGIAA